MIVQSQISRQTPQNYRHPSYLPENPVVFSQLPTFNGHPPCPMNYPGRIKWNGSKPERARMDHNVSGPGCPFGNPNGSSGKVRRFNYPKRRFNGGGRTSAPFAPRNTTSFLIRAKKTGGIASLVSPCAVTPAILTKPSLSPSTEVVVEMAKEKWGVDGYGTMKGLIRLRSGKENSGENNGGEVLEVEKRLNSDLSRFEMIYPSSGDEHSLENRVDEQDLQIAHLEEQNLSFKERIFLMERELSDLRQRVVCLETEGNGAGDRESENFNGIDVCSEKSVSNSEHYGG